MPSCMEDNFNDSPLKTDKKDGVFILNEGNFTYSNASLSYYDRDSNTVINDVFYRTNSKPLGDVAQSMVLRDSLAYIVLNNSGKIYIINKHNFNYVAKITGLSSPRHIHFVNDAKAYVSDLYAKAITIVDPMSYAIIGKIDLDNHNSNFQQHSSEQMLNIGNKVYVNCWSYDDKVLVINSDLDEVMDSIKVGKQPNSMVLDKNKNLWVLSDGAFTGSSFGQENASLTQINTSTNEIIKTFVFEDIDASPSHIQINESGDSLFYIYGNWGTSLTASGIHAMSIIDEMLPSSPIVPQSNGIFYSLGIDQKNHELYISNAKDFSQEGIVYRYTTEGTRIDAFDVGINPSYFCFDN